VRRSLLIRTLIVSVLTIVVFTVPLAVLYARGARARALDAAASDARALAPIVSLAGDPRVTGALASVASQARPRQVNLLFPDGSLLGNDSALERDPLASPSLLARAQSGDTFVASVRGGMARYEPVLRSNDTIVVIRVFVPTGELRQGVGQTVGLLIVVGALLVGLAAFVSDRLGRSLVSSVKALDDTARALAGGQLEARIEPSGPPEVAQVGSTLNVLAQRIEELILLERSTVADLSHRLRTPVTALRAEAALIRDPDAHVRIESCIVELTRSIDQIIRDAQQPVRSGLGIMADLGRVAIDRAKFWTVLAEDQGRLFTVDVQPGEHLVALVESDLVAVVDALLDNVFSHTPERSDLRLRVRSVGDEVELVVDDHGPGFASDTAPGRGASASGSTGLGLDIVRKTIESAGGTVGFRNRAQGGARVRATLPLLAARVDSVVR
jgi:signal transduction histidine kinase